MRIFITGGTGFIGAPLCRALAEHELLVLSRRSAAPAAPSHWRWLNGDLADAASWQRPLQTFQPDACIHAAWSGLPDYSFANNAANFSAGLALLQCLAEMRCPRVVVTGTCFEYGDLNGCVAEAQTPATQGLFASFKTAQRMIAQSLFTNTALVWARLFYVYGPGQRSTSLLPSLVKNLAAHVAPAIRTPDATQDFVHVDDVAHALALLSTRNVAGGIYNVGSGVPVRVRDMANLVARHLQQRDVYPHEVQPGTGFWADLSRLRKACPEFAPRTVESGVAETVSALLTMKRAA